MKLEGEDRERPWDDAVIFVGTPAMFGFFTFASYCSTNRFTTALVGLVFGWCATNIVSLIIADTARIKRNNQRREQEIARIDAQIQRLRKEAERDSDSA